MPTDPTELELHPLIEELADVFCEADDARLLARRAGFPNKDLPDFKTPMLFWDRVVMDISRGKTEGGIETLADAAAQRYPSNKLFAAYRTKPEPEPEPEPDSPPPSADRVDNPRTAALEELKAELIQDPPKGWGARAADGNQRALVDEALDLLPEVNFRGIASAIARRGKPKSLGDLAELEAVVAAVARRLDLDRFEFCPDDVRLIEELLARQLDELVTLSHEFKVHHPRTRRDHHEWFATAWSLSFRVPRLNIVDLREYPWQFPGWEEVLELDELPGQFPWTYLPPEKLTLSTARMMLLSFQVVLKLGRGPLGKVPRLMLPAAFLTEELYDRLEAENLFMLRGSWEERFLVEELEAQPTKRRPLANLAWRLAGQTNDGPDSVVSRIIRLVRRIPRLGPVLLVDVDPAVVAETACTHGTHVLSAAPTELRALTVEQRRAVLRAWHRRPTTDKPDWLEARELMSIFEVDDGEFLEAIVEVTQASTKVASFEFAGFVWQVSEARALQESRRALESGLPSAAGWFYTAPSKHLAHLLDTLDETGLRPEWLGNWAERRLLDGGEASERLYRLSSKLS